MFVDEGHRIHNVYQITGEQKDNIKAFLQGGVYCWCKNRKDEWFSLRDLMGGDNFHWQGTPLIELYKKHKDKEDSVKSAGIDAGWLLKAVINEDERVFETKKSGLINHYRWIKKNSVENILEVDN
ncbi:hypothetical protein QL982_02365 [Psychrobacter sp. 5A.1]|uniref:hypothetical protein n=1 Tax=Psychrobacter sp. 5A.1 TaxID=3035207 RepID=UPI0025B331FD|nr:hypothetical protein [Psychrobacter sp. 5A.1]MDN3501578.1 hypothetical protein [Psychrobacter sp. 5A.1]